jgi:hypothetical protein
VWNGIDHLIKEVDLKLLEERDGDPRKKRLQVSVGTSEPKPAEVRKCGPRHDPWSMQQLSLNAVEIKADPQCLQLWHEEKPLE